MYIYAYVIDDYVYYCLVKHFGIFDHIKSFASKVFKGNLILLLNILV